MDLGPHAAFIVAAYAMAGFVLGALVVWIVADHRIQRRLLADLDRSGVVRRSDRRTRDGAAAPAKPT